MSRKGKRPGSTPVQVRFDGPSMDMLDRLVTLYNNNRAVIIRMAIKQLYDKNFKKGAK